MRARAAAVLLAAAALTGFLCAAPNGDGRAFAEGSRARSDLRLDGEYGLFVALDGDTVRVRWITRISGPGFLAVEQDGTVLHDFSTPGGNTHAAEFTHIGGGSVTLRYGSATDNEDRHETRVRFDTPARPAVSYAGVDSLFVLSDVHGEVDTLIAVLRNARVIDEQGEWIAGGAHLVIAGDVTDRGADVNRLLWFLYDLEARATQAGGHLGLVLGNHEVMVITGDLRYVHPKEMAVASFHGTTYNALYDPSRSILGAWLASKPALVRVNDVLIAHGGVSRDYVGFTLESYDDTLRAYTGEELFWRWSDNAYQVDLDSAALARRNDFFWDDRSVFWYRGYAQDDATRAELEDVLRSFDSTIHVIGHTPANSIHARHAGQLIVVNTIPLGSQLLLLIRDDAGYEAWRYRTSGEPERMGRTGRTVRP